MIQLLAFATDELSMRVGQTLAGLMNATLVSLYPLPYSLIHAEPASIRAMRKR